MDFGQYYFTEVLSNELMSLQRYLQMDDESKAVNRAIDNPYLIDDFLVDEGYLDPNNKKFNKSLLKIKKMGEDYEKVEWLYENSLKYVWNMGNMFMVTRDTMKILK